MSVHVAIIGAGSLTFTRCLVRDILAVPEFADTRFSLTDIDRLNLDRAVRLCRKDVTDSRLPARVVGTPSRRRALEGADYVINIDVLRRTGYYSTESNGHLSEYLPWYRKDPARTAKWVDKSSWIHGETGGYLRVCTEGRNDFNRNFGAWIKAPADPVDPARRSHEHGSHIIEALETGRVYRGHFIVPNRGCITNLPDDCMVEVPGYVDRNGMSIPKVDEMLVAQREWLPQYRHDIPAASRRLAAAKRRGDYRGTRNFRGAFRVKTRTSPARRGR